MPLKQLKVSESIWCVFAVSLTIVGMLVAFYSVVRGATTAGELRRQETAAQAAAVTRCHAVPNGAIRKHCLSALDNQINAISPIVIAAQ